MRLGGILVLVEQPQALAEDEIRKEGPEGGLTRVGPEGEEEKNADERPGPEKRLKVVKLKHGAKNGDGSDGKRSLPLASEERLESVGRGDVGACEWYMLVTVSDEAEAIADGRTHAHVRICGC